jgi:hypothetical protein
MACIDANQRVLQIHKQRAPVPVKYYGSATNFRDSKLQEEDKFGYRKVENFRTY